MATRRCFSTKVVESDAFRALSVSAQALYLHLSMYADDDGCISNASFVSGSMRNGASAMQELVEKRFLLAFGSVYVVKHWRISNSLKNDRLKPPNYPEVAAKVWIKPNKSYTDHPISDGETMYQFKTGKLPCPADNGIQTESKWNPDGIPTEPNLTKLNSTKPNPTEAADAADMWREILIQYPAEKVGNQVNAEGAYRMNVLTMEDANTMLTNLKLWLQSEQWTKEGGQYIPQLVNWISRGTWRTRPSRMATPKGASGNLGLAEMEAIWQQLPPEDAARARQEYMKAGGDL